MDIFVINSVEDILKWLILILFVGSFLAPFIGKAIDKLFNK